ncbi:transposase [Egicoccus halophilus]|uniref:transposase n=1 Tax=Egicoccus halophilus TaxID=1670830 RepID=UPI0013EE6206
MVADAFHLVRLALKMMDEVRRRRQQQIHGHRGRKDDTLFKLRCVLRVGRERLDEDRLAKISTGCVPRTPTTRSAPRGSRSTCSARCTPHPRHRPPPTDRLLRVGRGGEIDEILRLARTLDTWQEEVLAVFDTRATNAATESAIIGSPVRGVVDVADGAVRPRRRRVIWSACSTSPTWRRRGCRPRQLDHHVGRARRHGRAGAAGGDAGHRGRVVDGAR